LSLDRTADEGVALEFGESSAGRVRPVWFVVDDGR
jgi:hypothetical protein